MRPARFVTLCFLYSGVVLLAQAVLVSRFRLDVASIVQVGAAFSILFVGLLRLSSPEKQEREPTEYGFLAYGMAVLSLVVTAILFVQLFVS
jgi:hypothetical protein